MLRFKYPTYDLLKYGQQMKKPVSRRNFARQVVDLATQLALNLNSSQQIQRSIELLHNQISGLRWKTYIFIIPVQSHSMSRDTCGPEGREDLLPESLLATVSFYKSQLNFANQDERYFCKKSIGAGLEWLCQRMQYEGVHSAFNTVPLLSEFDILSTKHGSSSAA